MPKPTSSTALITQSHDAFEQAAHAVIDAKRSESTRKAYRNDLRRWVTFCLSHGVDPNHPTLMAATAFRDQLVKAVAGESALRAIAALSSIHKTLLQGRIVTANPFHPGVLAWPPTGTAKRTVLVAPEVAEAMIAAALAQGGLGILDAALLQLFWDTGLRRASVIKLLRADYNPPMLHTTVKGGAEVDITLPASSIEALDRWLRMAPDSIYVFPNYANTSYVGETYVNTMVARRAKAAGAKDHIHPHSFRAAFATAGYDAGLPEYEIQAGLHHADPKTTRRYDRGARGGSVATSIATFRKRTT